ncbi:MAG: hypothetical protein Q8S84_07275 [bacterium]|nr:hypothetical protein [bacterium]MDP3381255.1 hypothetical protein [bacterium]
MSQVTSFNQETSDSSIKNCVKISDTQNTLNQFHIQIGVISGLDSLIFATRLFNDDIDDNSDSFTYFLLK